jgi:hypothetical protein
VHTNSAMKNICTTGEVGLISLCSLRSFCVSREGEGKLERPLGRNRNQPGGSIAPKARSHGPVALPAIAVPQGTAIQRRAGAECPRALQDAG